MPARLDTAAVFESVFSIYRRQASLLLPAALLVFLPVACFAVLAAVTGSVALFIVGVVAGVLAQFWFQGMVVEAVRDMLDGRRDFTLEGLLRSVTPVLGALVWAGVMAAIGITLGFLALIIPGLVLLTLWALIAPVIVIERRPATAAFGRSRELVRGNGWRVFGVIVVLFFIQALVGTILQSIGDSAGGDVGSGVGQLVGNVLLAPLTALAASVMYFQLTGTREAVPAGMGDASGLGAGAGPAGWGAGGPETPGGWAPPAPPPDRSAGPPGSGSTAPPERPV